MQIIPFKYAYFIGSLYFIGIFSLLFFRMAGFRKKMLAFGAVYLWFGIVAEYFWWTKDWWHPLTLTNTRIGIEDVLLSFTHIIIPVFLYKYVFKKDSMYKNKEKSQNFGCMFSRLVLVLAMIFGSMFFFSNILKLHSFISTDLGMLLMGLIVITRRKDLIAAALWTAALMVIVTYPVYFLGLITSPGVIEKIWDPSVSRFVFLGYPLADMSWYLIGGFLMGGIYEFISGRQITNSNKPGLKDDLSAIYNIGMKFIEGEKLD